jgi:hypothetical protein
MSAGSSQMRRGISSLLSAADLAWSKRRASALAEGIETASDSVGGALYEEGEHPASVIAAN